MNSPVPIAPAEADHDDLRLAEAALQPALPLADQDGVHAPWCRDGKDGTSEFRPGRNNPASVIVGDAGVVPGTYHADDVDAVGRGRLERVQLLARQEDHIAGLNPRLAILGPHAALP